ncbi:MAG TPA: glycogen synthase GlgA [Kiritimatiellia bacterium]|nr:glycogen synthase GlgA [Kiritimatiellia bacterium]HMO97903.1 glycogen synthase GlgA [Kiritimatiellia bacterium]HMP95577.1 glycogen synthase GlgA [Kiritimatiellia bacterium]
MLNLAFVSSEISPYASTGGLADVCGSLPKALEHIGYSVTQFMPMYRRVMEGPHPVEDTGIRLQIPVGFHRYQADIWKSRGKGPAIYFIRRDEFFDRSELYNLPDRDYDDNFERFIFYQKAVTALIDTLGSPFDIVHAHDWQAGLMGLYLKHGLSGEGRTQREKVVFTIHNLAFQGVFGGDNYSYTNLPFSCFSVDTLEFYGNVNCLKAGITTADHVTTVSQSYAREIQTPEWGCGLEGVLSEKSDRLSGIVNGIDPTVWNPEVDKHITAKYSPDDLEGKKSCKADLIRRMKLTIKPSDPLLGIVTRLTPQKGIALLDAVLPTIMQETNAGLVILGSGTEELLALTTGWAKRWPGRVAAKSGFDIKLAHRIEAGADIYLMPSQFEPCGLNQLYSLRYGAIPVVHRVGGLADTITDVTAQPTAGNGFTFDAFTEDSFLAAVRRAVALYGQPKRWTEIQRRAMRQDFTWTASAKKYAALYEQVVGSA